MIQNMENDLTFYIDNNNFNDELKYIFYYCDKNDIPVIIKNISQNNLLSILNTERLKNMTIEINDEFYTIYDNSIKEELINLYKSNFDDSPDYINYFFDDFSINNVYYMRKDRKIVSAFYLQYKTLFLKKEIKIPYIVAASTNYKYRKKGLFKAIFKRYLYESNDPFCLLSPDIFSFYEKLGFNTIIYNKMFDMEMIDANINDIKEIYNKNIGEIYLKKDFKKLDNIIKIDNLKLSKSKDGLGYTISSNGIDEYFHPEYYNKEKGIPYIMGRVVNAKEFLKLCPIKANIIDPICPKNNIDCYYDESIDVSELILKLFDKKNSLILDRY